MKAKLVAATLGIGMVVGSLVGGMQVDAAPGGRAKSVANSNYACDCQTMVTTTRLNLREGPSTNNKVLYVMPEGLEVQMDLQPGMHQNGFVHISWDEGENYGWAAEQFLAEPGSGGGSSDDGGWGEDDAFLEGVAEANSRVNFRSGPGTGYAVKYVIEAGDTMGYTDLVVNGFRFVGHNGNEGWVHDDYIDPAGGYGVQPGKYSTATSNLNLRAEPSLSADVLLVIPMGADVMVNVDNEGNFRSVTYNGVTGWAYETYLG
jgi:uncharacterized protein YraI